VSAAYPPYSFGGIDMQTYDLAHGLSSEGVDVTVFCGYAKQPTLTQEDRNLRICRLPLYDIPPRVLSFQLRNADYFKKNLGNFDLVHTQHSSGSVIGFLKKRIGKPWIVSFHDHQLRRLSIALSLRPWDLNLSDMVFFSAGYPLFEFMTRIEIKYADHYIACGFSGFEDYVRYSKMTVDKTTLIQNGIDLAKIESAARSFKETRSDPEQDGGLTIFTCGRLYTSKGIQYLIRAMPKVVKNFPDVHLKIFGKGPLRSRLETLINHLGLSNNASLEGHVPYDRLMYEMNRSDLAVFPSLIEVGASLAVMEAMGFRKTVVAFDYPFTTEIIEHLRTGYVVPPKHVEELGKAISVLLGDRKLREKLGENAHSKIMKDHNWSDVIKKYIQVYRNVIEARS
jgi:glycosyltransferase involved in cell wall biosynthesis